VEGDDPLRFRETRRTRLLSDSSSLVGLSGRFSDADPELGGEDARLLVDETDPRCRIVGCGGECLLPRLPAERGGE